MRVLALCCLLVSLAAGQPAKHEFWKGTSMDAVVDQTKLECSQKNDEVACMKFKVLNFIDQVLRKDNFKISETVEVTRNSYPEDAEEGRGDKGYLSKVQAYLATHDATFKLPFDSEVRVSARNLDEDQLSFDVKFGEGRAVQEARRSKLKKVIIPILVFLLLKALTLIPLAIGVLGLKAWNALQLSFFSFVVSVGLAIFQLCKKIAADSHAAPLAAHGPWEYQAAQYRAFQEPAQDLAYSAYART